ncbi:carbamoyltransferase C-terminal domain-containing protein [Dactylosporangium darangshiense]|uniref:carbamoyltransferase C-terminal domain-containing protein n=1 Tax=Dactylosporangium darangshiense TaxID=579108 RepID=UPI00363788CD
MGQRPEPIAVPRRRRREGRAGRHARGAPDAALTALGGRLDGPRRAAGVPDGDIKESLREVFAAPGDGDFADELDKHAARLGAEPDDVAASAHELIADLLAERLADRAREWIGGAAFNLCFTGSMALDIRWNGVLRAHPMVAAMWVPPFPGASGTAFGAAALRAGRGSGLRAIGWDLRCGPAARRTNHVPAGWSVAPCRPEELARLMHRTGRPAVVVAGRAKLGPRALGSRSILAPATDAATGALLDRLRARGDCGPAAPLCRAERAADVFDPGFPDPFMQFEHHIREEWADRLPALRGADRLQTVTLADDPVLATLLREYEIWSGVPVLCTAGGGGVIFADAASAMQWGEIGLVWNDGVLYRRTAGLEADAREIR